MSGRRGLRPAHVVVMLLAVAPAWKVVEHFRRPGPKPVSAASAAAGRELFNHEWSPGDPLTKGDGLGPVYNAKSCVECHNQGGPGGGGPVSKNVVVYGLLTPETRGIPRSGVVHQKAVRPEFQETLDLVHSGLPHEPTIALALLTGSPRITLPPEVVVTQRNTPALFGDGLIDAVPDETLIAHQRAHSTPARLAGLNGARDKKVRGRIARLADGRIGRFGWKSEFATLGEFVKAACANELGLSNPDRPQATPLGRPNHKEGGVDLTDEQCVVMTDFIRGLDVPSQIMPTDSAEARRVARGKELFDTIGCVDCHSENLGPVAGIYSDMLLHDMGLDMASSTGYYGAIIPQPTVRNDKFSESDQPSAREWRTAPLWGVADSAPYMHDGRADTLEQAIELHGGEAEDMVATFKTMAPADRDAIVAFLKTLRAPSASETVAAK
jgi:CxxC motif-containing protein (DUF1111 family)